MSDMQSDGSQEGMYKKLNELTNELNAVRARYAYACKEINDKLDIEQAIKEINGKSLIDLNSELQTLNVQLAVSKAQIEAQAATITQLNDIIKARDRELGEVCIASAGIHEKLDKILSRSRD